MGVDHVNSALKLRVQTKPRQKAAEIFSNLERGRDRLIKVIFGKSILEIRTDNSSLTLKILNGTPRPTFPSKRLG